MILALEASTTSAKALLYNAAANKVERVVSEPYGETAWPEKVAGGLHDPRAVAACAFKLGRQVCEGVNGIEAVALCGTFHSVLVAGAGNGGASGGIEPLTPTYTWMSPIAENVTARLRKDQSWTNEYYRRTGCMVHALYPAFQLLRLREDGFNFRDARVMSESGYLFYLLTGIHRETACTNSGGGLINLQSRGWDEETLAFAGLKNENMGTLTDYRSPLPLSHQGAGLLGLPEGIPVLPSYPDGALNQTGAGALRKGVMTFSMGTSAALRLSTEKPLVSDTRSTWCYLSPSAYLAGAAVSGACNCVDWIKNALFPLTSYANVESEKPNYQNMPYFLPFIFGERCPGWNDNRRGGFHALSSAHTPKDMYYSVLEGVLFNLYQCYEALTVTAGAPEQIQLSGGILNSPHWKEMCASLFGRDIHCAKIPHVSLIGGAVLAMEVCGYISKKEDYKIDINEVIHPNMDEHKILAGRYTKYKEYYGLLC
jgi:gluconokinase